MKESCRQGGEYLNHRLDNFKITLLDPVFVYVYTHIYVCMFRCVCIFTCLYI